METGNGTAKLAWIEKRLAEGRTVYLRTHLRTTAVEAHDVERFHQDGRALFRVESPSNHLRMLQGKRYVDAEYCKLTAS